MAYSTPLRSCSNESRRLGMLVKFLFLPLVEGTCYLGRDADVMAMQGNRVQELSAHFRRASEQESNCALGSALFMEQAALQLTQAPPPMNGQWAYCMATAGQFYFFARQFKLAIRCYTAVLADCGKKRWIDEVCPVMWL